jgi:hypothetical protein
MRELEGKGGSQEDVKPVDLADIVTEVKKSIKPEHHFLEIVLYFYPDPSLIDKIKKEFQDAFAEKQILVFVGSDWNHQSYQAAFASRDTFYLLLLSASYKRNLEAISDESLIRNVDTLKLIAKATHITIEDKALLFPLSTT